MIPATNLAESIARAHRDRLPLVMGIINVTPDSFSDGGQFLDPARALDQARHLVDAGADILDVGGESTRPGAEPVSLEEELARVVPVVRAIVAAFDVPVSVDTSKPRVMRESLVAGASMINDVNGFEAEGAWEAVADNPVPLCVMHRQGEPGSMQKNPSYHDVLGDIRSFFEERIRACENAGIDAARLVLDPGFGFGKTLAHNLALLAGLETFSDLGCPILVGLSRKSMLASITGRKHPVDRLAGSLAAAVMAADRGASIVRVHDVAETVDAMKVVAAVTKA